MPETAPKVSVRRWQASGLGSLLLGAWLLTTHGARAEEPPTPRAQSGATQRTPPTRPPSGGSESAASAEQAAGRAGAAATGSAARSQTGATPSGSGSGATETVALEIVAKAPKPIPPVELDMLQLRLMLTDLKASFADEIDRALFREPF